MSTPSSPTLRRQQQGRPTPGSLALSQPNLMTEDIHTPPTTSDAVLDSVTPPLTPTRRKVGQASALSTDSRDPESNIAVQKENDSSWISATGSEAPYAQDSPLTADSDTKPNSRVQLLNNSSTASAASSPLLRRASQPNHKLSISRRVSAASRHPAQLAINSDMGRFLVTVIPPEHLPHDPPHPKSNPNCTGYGPPAHFRSVANAPLGTLLLSDLSRSSARRDCASSS